MRLLICTQTVDRTDPFLGFFHRWIEEFAHKCEHVEVICLKEGEHQFPPNVRVHSLGKEAGMPGGRLKSRLRYARRFLGLAWRLRREYDDVFVHMNVEYVVLGGLLWRLTRKSIGLWYNHGARHVSLSIAMMLAHLVFYTSSFAATAKSRKAHQMPVGIDTNLFRPHGEVRTRGSVYMQGRVMRSKRVHVLLEALYLLRERGVPVSATIVGPEDPVYGKELRTRYAPLVAEHIVTFAGPREHDVTPTLFSSHEVAVNLADRGCFDKSAVESLACETPVVASSDALADLVPFPLRCREDDPASLADALQHVLSLPQEEQRALGRVGRDLVITHHSLAALIPQVITHYRNWRL